MAKSTVHQDKLGSYDDFKAPWESETGTDAEVDKPKLKRLWFNVKGDLAKAKDAAEDAKADLTAAETARDEAVAASADGTGAESQKQIDKLTNERDAAQAKVDKFEADKDLADLRKEVLGDFEAENPKAAKYVVGTTKEELEESLEAVKEDFGITDEDPEEEDEEDEPVVRTRPRTASLRNPADAQNGKGGEATIDFDKVASDYIAGGSVFR